MHIGHPWRVNNQSITTAKTIINEAETVIDNSK